MTHNPQDHHRRSIRLKGYDYSRPGAYFVTLCVHNRECLLGEVGKTEMQLNDSGRVAQTVWDELPTRYPGVVLDAFVIMPNHVHGVIMITAAASVGAILVGVIHELPLPELRDINDPAERRRMLLPKIIGYYKMNMAKRANQIRGVEGVPFWQRNYYEHIVRNERELSAIRQYIRNNPLQWALDRDNPHNIRHLPPPGAVKDYLTDISTLL
jgi:REP element-mobilizing transposase RayT